MRFELFNGIKNNVIVLGIVSFFTDVSSEMIFPLLPVFLTTFLGAGTAIIGLIEGVADSASSIFDIFSGYWSDKLSKRKEFVLLGYGLSSISKLGIAFASTWPVVLVFRGIERIGKSIRTSPRDALIAASADKSVRGKAFGFQRMLDSFGAILGPIIAYFVFALLGSGENAYRGIFYAALIPAFLAVLIILLFVREPKGKVSASTNKADAKDKPNFLQSISMLGREHKRFILVSCIFSLAYFSFAMLILRANDIGILAQDILLVYVIYNVVHALASMPVGQLSDRIGRKPVIAFEFLLYAGICVGFAFVSNLWQVALLFAAYGVFVAIDDSVSKAYISDISEDKTRGIALGSYYTAVGIAYLPASILFGVAWAALGPTTSFLGAAAIAVLASVAMVVYTK